MNINRSRFPVRHWKLEILLPLLRSSRPSLSVRKTETRGKRTAPLAGVQVWSFLVRRARLKTLSLREIPGRASKSREQVQMQERRPKLHSNLLLSFQYSFDIYAIRMKNGSCFDLTDWRVVEDRERLSLSL